MCPSKAERSARYYFWDQQLDLPQAPDAWPRSQNIPISVLQADLDSPSRRHYGQDSLLCGFWWAYAQAIKVGQIATQKGDVEAKEADARTKKFERLCLNALADWKVFVVEDDVIKATFQSIEDSEEQRENNGFTGFRKILLVCWALQVIKRDKPKEKQISHDEVAEWLHQNLRFHDEKQRPTANVVRDLTHLAKNVLKKKRVMEAVQEVEVLWGRNTMFDDYSKLTVMVNKSRGADDLAFMVEMMVVRMKASTKEGDLPDNPARGSLQGKHGDPAQTQLARDTLAWIRKTGPASWKAHEEILKDLFTPTGFQKLFPIPRAGQTAPDITKMGAGQTASEAGPKVLPAVVAAVEQIRRETTAKGSRAPNSLLAVVAWYN